MKTSNDWFLRQCGYSSTCYFIFFSEVLSEKHSKTSSVVFSIFFTGETTRGSKQHIQKKTVPSRSTPNQSAHAASEYPSRQV